ncbi:PGPGW domain-containing protein [Parvularcula sp. IMCC14364]|uniref:PGPGW domain-containing protein n=1 Tax=Parvularcula sp. IMCC14364 TaxID=3067902 RepID=UPI00274219B7|nr:PGPGW domain-containing protein [Parvularcula sp. IMCC14364]
MLAIFHQIMGSVLVVAGIVVLPLPIPLGLLMLVIGLALLAPYIIPVQNLVRSLRRKNTKLNNQLVRWREKFPPVIQKTIDRTHP